jgi:hypothetical protein
MHMSNGKVLKAYERMTYTTGDDASTWTLEQRTDAGMLPTSSPRSQAQQAHDRSVAELSRRPEGIFARSRGGSRLPDVRSIWKRISTGFWKCHRALVTVETNSRGVDLSETVRTTHSTRTVGVNSGLFLLGRFVITAMPACLPSTTGRTTSSSHPCCWDLLTCCQE